MFGLEDYAGRHPLVNLLSVEADELAAWNLVEGDTAAGHPGTEVLFGDVEVCGESWVVQDGRSRKSTS